MKRSPALLLASLLAAPLLFAQGVVNSPTAQSPGEKPDPLPSQPASSTITQGIPLIPQTPPVESTGQDAGQTTGQPAAAGKKKNKKVLPSRTEAAEDAMILHIKLRRAKTKALQDPVIQAELAKAGSTKTDYDTREVYKRYYVLLYARMLQIDPSIAAGINLRAGNSIYRNYQLHIFPTVPLDQIGQAKPTGPENAVTGAVGGGTPPPRRSFGQARIGSF